MRTRPPRRGGERKRDSATDERTHLRPLGAFDRVIALGAVFQADEEEAGAEERKCEREAMRTVRHGADPRVRGASRQIPLGELGARMGEIEAWEGKPVVVVDRDGARSASACRMLTAAGFQQVSNLEGGMVAWRQAGD